MTSSSDSSITINDMDEDSRTATLPTVVTQPQAQDAAVPFGIEHAPDDEDDVPIPPAQLDAVYEEMEEDVVPFGIENAPDDDDAAVPIPPAQLDAAYKEMEEAITESIDVTQDNDDAPIPFAQTAAGGYLEADDAIDKEENGLEIIEDGESPLFSFMSQAEEDSVLKKSTLAAPSPVIIQATQQPELPSISQNQEPVSPVPVSPAIITRPPPRSMLPSHNELSSASDSPSEHTFHQVQARLVEDGIVYDAELIRLSEIRDAESISDSDSDSIPHSGLWWKRHQRSLFVGSLVVLIIVGLTAAYVATRSSEGPPVDLTPEGNMSLFTTENPSMAPTGCALKISRQAQNLELSGFDMVSPVFAIDGVNGILASGSGYVIFFLLSGNKLVMTRTFLYESLGSLPRVAISGSIAVVGNPIGNTVHIFEQQGDNSEKGLWEELEQTLSPPDDDVGAPYFGGSVDVHGNIITVGAPLASNLQGSVYIYLRSEEGSWLLQEKIRPATLCPRAFFGFYVTFDGSKMISSAACRDSIYIYKINQHSGETILLQDPLTDVYVDKSYFSNILYEMIADLGLPSAVSLNNDLLLLTNATGIHVYHQASSIEQFTFVQYIEVENFGDAYYGQGFSPDAPTLLTSVSEMVQDYGEGYLFPAAIDNDLFVLAAGKVLHVFQRGRDNVWVEAVQLESDMYAYAKGNNATLFKGTIGVSGRSLMFVVDDVMITHDLESCTQDSPTNSPTAISSSSQKLLLTESPSTRTPSTSPTTLLPTVSFNPTAEPSLTTLPTVSSIPTTSPSKSLAPSSSLAPTICYTVDVSLFFDVSPTENIFEIRIVDEGNAVEQESRPGTVVATGPDWANFEVFSSYRGADLFQYSICLEEGMYEFVMYDSSGDGMCCDMIIQGYYRLESSGKIIAEGEDFGYKETTAFSIPFE